MKQCMERLYNGMIKENPTFVLMLGMCPTLAVTTSAINGLGMGLSTMVVLALSNLMISALRKIIPDKVRIPAYIVIIATFVTVVELLLHAYLPTLYESLGIYISLIVVNCIILGRAESYASKNKMLPSLFDGIGMGLGFTMALTLIGLVREFLGAGTVFGFSGTDLFGAPLPVLLTGLIDKWLEPNSASEGVQFWNRFLTDEVGSFGPMSIMVMAPGAFFILAILTAIQNVFKEKGRKAGKDVSKIQSGCNSDCMNCKDSGCKQRKTEETEPEVAVETTEEKEAEPEAVVETAEEKEAEPEAVVETAEEKEAEPEAVVETAEEKEAEPEAVVETAEEKEAEPEAVVETAEEKKIENKAVQEPVKDEIKETATKQSSDKAVKKDSASKRKSKKESVNKTNVEPEKKPKRKKTLLEATQEIDIVELEALLGEEEGESNE